jgi:dTDP-4-dehydrorhamnose 3,5-epimerase
VKRIDLDLPGVCLIEPVVHGDDRGFFMETYTTAKFADIGIDVAFVQDNHSKSRGGVLRGLHWQVQQTQAKLVRVTKGEVFDVAVDIRRGSPTYGKWVGEILSEANKRMLFVPGGFAHGFQVLSEEAEFIYKCSDLYAPQHERGLIWNDPNVGIEWPGGAEPALSAKDAAYPTLDQLSEGDCFVWEGP